jgi:hypothetical protein
MVSWLAFKSDQVSVSRGTPKVRASSEHARRHFCADCGAGLFYTNEAIMPGIVDVQSATLDDAEAVPPGVHVQYAEHLSWIERMDDLPKFDRFPD